MCGPKSKETLPSTPESLPDGLEYLGVHHESIPQTSSTPPPLFEINDNSHTDALQHEI